MLLGSLYYASFLATRTAVPLFFSTPSAPWCPVSQRARRQQSQVIIDPSLLNHEPNESPALILICFILKYDVRAN